MTDSIRLFDPALVIPSEDEVYEEAFWRRLHIWTNTTRPPVMGQSTYLFFAENFRKWLEKATRNKLQAYTPLINQLVSRVIEPWTAEADGGPVCQHILDAYTVDETRDHLNDDLAFKPNIPVEVVSEIVNWIRVEQMNQCGACLQDDLRLVLSPETPTVRLAELPGREQVALIPVETADSCLYDGHNNHYIHDAGSGLWWSIDFANHGGTVFKTFRQHDAQLQHEADRDLHGIPIESKHKGSAGAVINMSELNSCAHPERHVTGS